MEKVRALEVFNEVRIISHGVGPLTAGTGYCCNLAVIIIVEKIEACHGWGQDE